MAAGDPSHGRGSWREDTGAALRVGQQKLRLWKANSDADEGNLQIFHFLQLENEVPGSFDNNNSFYAKLLAALLRMTTTQHVTVENPVCLSSAVFNVKAFGKNLEKQCWILRVSQLGFVSLMLLSFSTFWGNANASRGFVLDSKFSENKTVWK